MKAKNSWCCEFSLKCAAGSGNHDFPRSPLCHLISDPNFTRREVEKEVLGLGWMKLRGYWFCPSCAVMQPMIPGKKS